MVSVRQSLSNSSLAHALPLALTLSKFPILSETQLSHLCNKEEVSCRYEKCQWGQYVLWIVTDPPSLSCLFKLLKWLPSDFLFFALYDLERSPPGNLSSLPPYMVWFQDHPIGLPHDPLQCGLACVVLLWSGPGHSVFWDRAPESTAIPVLIGVWPWNSGRRSWQDWPPGHVTQAISQSLERAPAWFNALLMLSWNV